MARGSQVDVRESAKKRPPSRCRTDCRTVGLPLLASFSLSLYSRVKVYLSGEGPGFRGGCRTSSAAPVTRPAGRSDAANKSGRMTEIAANVFLGMGMPSERARERATDKRYPRSRRAESLRLRGDPATSLILPRMTNSQMRGVLRRPAQSLV